MKWHDFESESSSGLHCTNRYGSPNHPMVRSLNRQCIGFTANTNSNLLLPSSDRTNEFIIVVTRNQTHREGGELTHITRSHMYPYTHATRAYTHTCVPTYIHICKYTHTYTLYMHIPTHAYTSTHKHTHDIHTYMHTHAQRKTNTHIIIIHTQLNSTHT